jgi:S1-C subfamily serine protease
VKDLFDHVRLKWLDERYDFHNIGDTVELQIQREGRKTQVNVTLQALQQLLKGPKHLIPLGTRL